MFLKLTNIFGYFLIFQISGLTMTKDVENLALIYLALMQALAVSSILYLAPMEAPPKCLFYDSM